jgi:CspA family cold shock protein
MGYSGTTSAVEASDSDTLAGTIQQTAQTKTEGKFADESEVTQQKTTSEAGVGETPSSTTDTGEADAIDAATDSQIESHVTMRSRAMSTTRGQVKWFDPKKGYGFIVGPNDQDVFVHYSQIEGDGFRSLKDGETVDYELVEGDKGLQAQTVSRLEPTPTD